MFHRRNPAPKLAAAILAASLLFVTGCGASASASDEPEGTAENPVTVRFAWWGNDSRAKTTLEVIKKFEEENPGIKVKGESSEYGSYWDKMATQVAGGNMPDLISTGGAYTSEYSSRGALLDLATVKDEIDTSKFVEGTVELGQIDGTQYAITAGVNSMAMALNPAVFQAAGVELPDDNTWTWDDYTELATKISEGSPAGTFGTTPNANETFLSIWARQSGEQLYADDGKSLAISEDRVSEWMQLNVDLLKSGKSLSASQFVEDGSAQSEQSLMGQGKQGMKIVWSSQLGSYPVEGLTIAKMPGESPKGGNWLRSGLEYAISSKTEHPKATAKFLSYLVNSVGAGELVKSDKGMPANVEVRAAIKPLLSENQSKEAAYLDRVGEMNLTPPRPDPAGSSATLEVLNRNLTDVLFEKATVQEGAKKFIEEVNQNLL